MDSTPRIGAVIRRELGLYGDDDELFEGTISAGELADAIATELRKETGSPASTADRVQGETRPVGILAIRAQALDRVQELIAPGDGPWVDPPLPTQEQWNRIVEAAFPPPPMA